HYHALLSFPTRRSSDLHPTLSGRSGVHPSALPYADSRARKMPPVTLCCAPVWKPASPGDGSRRSSPPSPAGRYDSSVYYIQNFRSEEHTSELQSRFYLV